MIYHTTLNGPFHAISKYLKHRLGIVGIYTVNIKFKHTPRKTMKLHIFKVMKDKFQHFYLTVVQQQEIKFY